LAQVLVIEDEPLLARNICESLALAGYSTASAHSGEVGLEAAEKILPDVLLLDMRLPGMDGLAATALLKQDPATRAIPVIALTALAMKGDEARIREAGCDAYIAKPMRYQEVLATVAAQLVRP